jgi:hypothetical protein
MLKNRSALRSYFFRTPSLYLTIWVIHWIDFTSVGEEKEDYSHQMFLKCSNSLNLVRVLPILGISRTWRTQTYITYNKGTTPIGYIHIIPKARIYSVRIKPITTNY